MKNNCWEILECGLKECPARENSEKKCWLVGGTLCNDTISGDCIEKMSACVDCRVFKANYNPADCFQTLEVMSAQFKSVTEKLLKEKEELTEAQKKLSEFKTTSVYLLKELDKKNREIGVTVRNRTAELKEAESRLSQAAKVAALSRFSAGIAHEINNPLGAVINYIRTALSDPELKTDARNYLEQSLKGLFRIDNVVKQILSYSGRQNLEPVDINKLLLELADFNRFRLKEKSVKITLELAPDLPKTYADPSQLSQVFNNILKNAADAMEKTKRKETVISTLANGDVISIIFKDSGAGITPEQKEKLFTPFFTTKEVGEGTGLGLFISYNIIQVLRGTLDINNTPEGGAAVSITLPVYKELK